MYQYNQQPQPQQRPQQPPPQPQPQPPYHPQQYPQQHMPQHARITRSGQVKVYTGKCFRVFANEKGWKTFISSAIIAIIISWVAGSNMFTTHGGTRTGAFALICACIWMGVFNSIRSICRERPIIKREHRTGLHISSYITAHMIYELVICSIQAFITVIILYIIRDAPGQGIILPAFMEMLITFFLVIFAADVMGIAVSCVVKNENSAMTVMPFVLIIQLVMSGVFFQLEGAAASIGDFTISKWGVNAICSISDANSLTMIMGQVANNDYVHEANNLLKAWLILIVFSMLYGAIGAIILKATIDKDKR